MRVKYFILASSMMLSAGAFAQKDELKTLKKLYAKDKLSVDDISSYKANVNKLISMPGLAESDLVYANFYKSMLPLLELNEAMAKNPNDLQALTQKMTADNIDLLASGLNNVLDFEKKSGKEIYTSDIKETIAGFKPMIVQYAYGLNSASKFIDAAKVFAAVYKLDKKDEINLYNASVLAMQGKDYDYALQLLDELKKINYSGEGVSYLAVNKTSGKEEQFPGKQQRDIFVKAGSHEKPRDEKIPSKRGEVYKNFASILVLKGKIDEAKKALEDAKKINPSDTDLILAQANLHYETNDLDMYKSLVNEALALKPNDVDLLFNLGVVSTNTKDINSAKKYYQKVIEIDPNYTNAYNNLGLLELIEDDKIVNEMNSLGMSPKDSKRYDELKEKRKKMLNVAIPYFEKVLDLTPDNKMARSLLLSAYQFLEMDAKYKALKAK